uniref:Uncharacterized protein n=2 Tax=Opuntia streptacantha TaxID=393608 RepID=A0A7C8Z8S2_OPUST
MSAQNFDVSYSINEIQLKGTNKKGQKKEKRIPKGQGYNNPTNQFDLDGFAFDEPLFADPLFADFLRDFFFGFNLLEAEDDLSCLLLCFFSFCTLILLTALSTLSVS